MYQYTVKIKKDPSATANLKTYIWGGDALNFNLKSPLYLVIRNPELGGEDIQVFTQTTTATDDRDIGTLKEGQVFIIPLNDIKGVYATCDHDQRLDCSIEFVSNDTFVASLENG